MTMKAKGLTDKIDKKDCFYCYSFNLRRFLQSEKEILPIDVGFDKRTQKVYFIFIKTADLNEALKDWALRKEENRYYIPREVVEGDEI